MVLPLVLLRLLCMYDVRALPEELLFFVLCECYTFYVLPCLVGHKASHNIGEVLLFFLILDFVFNPQDLFFVFTFYCVATAYK